MAESPSFYTVVGYADMDGGVETFSELVWSLRGDAFAFAVAQALPGLRARQFMVQATEIATFVGVCVEAYSTGEVPAMRPMPVLALNPADDDLDDLQIYCRTYPGATPDDAPVAMFHWFDAFAGKGESQPYRTAIEALRARAVAVDSF